jgi:hypothetical protein
MKKRQSVNKLFGHIFIMLVPLFSILFSENLLIYTYYYNSVSHVAIFSGYIKPMIIE